MCSLTIPWTTLVAWSASLDPRCSFWHVYVLCTFCLPCTLSIGILSANFAIEPARGAFLQSLSPEYNDLRGHVWPEMTYVKDGTGRVGLAVFWFSIFYLVMGVSLCEALWFGRKALLLEYKTLAAIEQVSNSLLTEFTTGLGPVAFFLSLQMLSSRLYEREASEIYSANTPWCISTPGAPGDHNIETFNCSLRDEINEDWFPAYVAVTGKEVSGNGTVFVWTNWIGGGTNASNGNATNGSAVFAHNTVFGAAPLSHNDTERFRARTMYEEQGPPQADAAMYQGYAIIYGVFAAQILARVGRLDLDDVMRFNISFWEGTAIFSASILVSLALVMLSSLGTLLSSFSGAVIYGVVVLIAFIQNAILLISYARLDKKEDEEEGYLRDDAQAEIIRSRKRRGSAVQLDRANNRNTLHDAAALENPTLVKGLLDAVEEARTEAREAKAHAARLEEKLNQLEKVAKEGTFPVTD